MDRARAHPRRMAQRENPRDLRRRVTATIAQSLPTAAVLTVRHSVPTVTIPLHLGTADIRSSPLTIRRPPALIQSCELTPRLAAAIQLRRAPIPHLAAAIAAEAAALAAVEAGVIAAVVALTVEAESRTAVEVVEVHTAVEAAAAVVAHTVEVPARTAGTKSFPN